MSVIQDANPTSLARDILSVDRKYPLLVVSFNPQKPEARIDASWIGDQLGESATVFLLNNKESRLLSKSLPMDAEVSGNAVRVYEPKSVSTNQLPKYRLLHSNSPSQAARAAQTAVAQARECISQSATLVQSPARAKVINNQPSQVVARIESFTDDGQGGYVRTPDGRLLPLTVEANLSGIPLDWYLERGQEIIGTLTAKADALNITEALLKHRLTDLYRHGETILVMVGDKTKKSLELILYPGMTRAIKASDSHSDVVTGQVICALFYIDHGAAMISIEDANPNSVLPAPPLTPGGPPWLIQGRDLQHSQNLKPLPPHNELSPNKEQSNCVREDLLRASRIQMSGIKENQNAAEQDIQVLNTSDDCKAVSQCETAPHQSSTSQISELAAELSIAIEERNDALHEICVLQRRLARTQRQITDLHQIREKVRQLKKENNALERQVQALGGKPLLANANSNHLFLDEKEALRHEIYEVWASYIPRHEKDRYPAPNNYDLGERIAETLNGNTTPSTRTKAVETIVDLLVERVDRRKSLACKPLRMGNSATKPQLVRADGATGWRAHIEKHTPAALRLHYWKKRGNKIELDSVVPHDIYTM